MNTLAKYAGKLVEIAVVVSEVLGRLDYTLRILCQSIRCSAGAPPEVRLPLGFNAKSSAEHGEPEHRMLRWSTGGASGLYNQADPQPYKFKG